MVSRITALSLLFVVFFSGLVHGQQTRPTEKKFSEAQLKTFLETQKDWLQESAKILQDASNSKSDQAKSELVNVAQLYQTCLDRHQISRDDFESMGQRAADAFAAVAYLDGEYKTGLDKLDAETAQQNSALTDEQKRLEMYQEAQRNGWRVLNADDRDVLVKAALADQQSILEEVKQRADDVNSAETEAAQDDADVKTEEDEAKNPPMDISPDDRAEYVQNKHREADAARSSAKEARVEASDAKKTMADAQARADAAGQHAAHPEIPLTDDEKSQAKSDNDAAIKSAKSEIAATRQRLAVIAKEQADLEKTTRAMTRDVPAENIQIMRAYADQYQQQVSMIRTEATTRPAR